MIKLVSFIEIYDYREDQFCGENKPHHYCLLWGHFCAICRNQQLMFDITSIFICTQWLIKNKCMGAYFNRCHIIYWLRPADQEMIAIERLVCYSQSQEEGQTVPLWATRRNIGISQEAEEEGETRQEPLLWFLREVTDEAVWTGFGLANVNNFRRLWGIGTLLSCLVPGLRVIRTDG